MTTETTKTNDTLPLCGHVLYDDRCAMCTGLARRFEPVLRRRGFALAPLEAGPRTVMRVVAANGRTSGGADAVVFIARRIWWAWPLWAFSHLPGAMPVLRRAYRWIANHRHCMGGVCKVASHPPRLTTVEDLLDDLLD